MGKSDWVTWVVIGGVVIIGGYLLLSKVALPWTIDKFDQAVDKVWADPKMREEGIKRVMEKQNLSRSEAVKQLSESRRELDRLSKATYARPTVAYTMRYY